MTFAVSQTGTAAESKGETGVGVSADQPVCTHAGGIETGESVSLAYGTQPNVRGITELESKIAGEGRLCPAIADAADIFSDLCLPPPTDRGHSGPTGGGGVPAVLRLQPGYDAAPDPAAADPAAVSESGLPPRSRHLPGLSAGRRFGLY